MRRAVQPVAGTDTNFGLLSVYVQLFRFSGNVFGGLIVNAVLGAVISEVLLRTLLFILIGKAPLRTPIPSFATPLVLTPFAGFLVAVLLQC
jgi:hypothetical protein